MGATKGRTNVRKQRVWRKIFPNSFLFIRHQGRICAGFPPGELLHFIGSWYNSVVMNLSGILTALGFVVITAVASAQRINQEGRILPPLPVITNSILFDTSNADAVVSAMQIFPVTNPWNEDISHRPVAANSAQMISRIINDLSSSRRTLRLFQEMNFVMVPDDQPDLPFTFVDYPDQSDLNGGISPVGLYPIPTNMPVEGWPSQTGTQTLAQVQIDSLGLGGDRHSIVVQPGAGLSWESWQALLANSQWQAANGALFDLKTNALRPAGWTSGDAAGFPLFPALVRFDEAERGMVEHACRLVVKRTLYNNYIYPATHFAAPSTNTDTSLPSMGQRLRLKAAYAIPANWSTEEKAVLLALKKYGAMVADNGNFFSISITPDDRWPANAFNNISTLNITNFEVIVSTGPTEGPRSPGAPVANAGLNQTVPVNKAIPLNGTVVFSNPAPTILWTLYSGPASAAFGNAAITNTTVTFSQPGVYTLLLSAADNVHAVSYAAVSFTAITGIALNLSHTGTNIVLAWTGGTAPFVVQHTPILPPVAWENVTTTSVPTFAVAATNSAGFYRIQGQ